jgi:thiol-disulfide isomerase/thioredoxin
MNFILNMSNPKELHWKDIVSPTMTPDKYMDEFGDKTSSNYKNYEPELELLEKIRHFLKDKKEKLKIVALGAHWCPDCNKNVPRMIKIVKQMKSKNIEFRILYGIMVNALHKPGEVIWHKTRSPPEALDPKFQLKAIPTFYFFNKDNKFIGIIKENPKETIEADMLEILKNS